MTKDEMLQAQSDIEESYSEGFLDAIFKTHEYMKDYCWQQSVSHARKLRKAEEYYKDADK